MSAAVLSWLRGLIRGGHEEDVYWLREKLRALRNLVEKNDRVLELIAEAGEILGGEYVFDSKYLNDLLRELRAAVHEVVADLNTIAGNQYTALFETVAGLDARIQADLECRAVVPDSPYVLPLDEVSTEHADIVGEKLARLGELRARLGCRVPDGFVVTTRACHEFLERIGIRRDAEAFRLRLAEGTDGLEAEARELRDRVLAARLPRSLEQAIRRRVNRLKGGDGSLFAVRSSAVGEDGELSFAGQFETVLGVAAADVPDAYRRVVASLFSPEAIQYHRQHGVLAGCGLMAVGCLRMVPARASGVVYSLDPASTRSVQLVSAVFGLGKAVVEGEAPVDRFEVSREPGYPTLSTRIAEKSWKYVAVPGRGLVRQPLPESSRSSPSLTPLQVAELGELTCRIERYMKAAQDIEFAFDDEGRLILLQARPLSIPAPPPLAGANLPRAVASHRALLRQQGEVACRGIGSGRVHILSSLDIDPQTVPPGAVIVARAAAPRLGSILAGASAVITDLGSPTGHFAAIAREFRVPTIVATGNATETLRNGVEVTVDAEENVVYEGRVEELLRYHFLALAAFEDAPAFRLLRRVLRHIAPLTLGDPQSPGFQIERCRTYHDVIRFAHEKAIAELSRIGWVRPAGHERYVRRLELPIPLDLILVDLGEGLAGADGDGTVALDHVTSRPLLPLLKALAGAGAWETAPASMDLGGFMSSATRSAPLAGPLTARPEQNLALVSREYLHLSLRLGYHFNIVDAYLTDSPGDNYIYFRFAGGVTELARRSRRASLLRRILERYGFVTEGRADLVIGRVKGLSAEAMVERLSALGRLIGFTRQLDIFLRNDGLVNQYVERFMNPASTS